MSDFDPDAYLAEEKEFDPGEYLAEEQPEAPIKMAEPSAREQWLGGLVSFASGSPLFGTVAESLGGKAGEDAKRAAALATKQFSPEIAGVPVLPVFGSIASTLPAAAVSLPARIGISGATSAFGALSEAGHAGETAGERLARMGTAGALGAATAGAGEAVGAGFGALGKWFGAAAGRAAQRTKEAIEKARISTRQSKAGDIGRTVATQSLGLQKMVDVLERPMDYPAEQVAEVMSVWNSPEGAELRTRVVSNQMQKMREAFAAEPAQRAAFAEAAAAATPAAVAAETEAALAPKALASDLGGRMWRSIGQRVALGGLGVGAANLLGVDEWKGGLLGSMVAPGALQMMRNVAKAPKFQWAAYKGLKAGAEGLASASRGAAQAARNAQAAQARQNAYDELERRFGIRAESDDDLASKAFEKSATDPDFQPGRR